MEAIKAKTNKELPVNESDNSEEKKETPKKPRRNLDALVSSNKENKIENKVSNKVYQNSSLNKDEEKGQIKEKENIEIIPKKPRRNLDALEVSEKPKNNMSRKDQQKLDENKNDLSGLDLEIHNMDMQMRSDINGFINTKETYVDVEHRPRRDLSRLEADVNETKQKEQLRLEKKEKRERKELGKGDRNNKYYQQGYEADNIEEKKREEEKLKIDINNSEAFPSLSPTVAKTPISFNKSKWNIKSELVSSPIGLNSPVQTPTPRAKESFKLSKSYQKNISSTSLNSPSKYEDIGEEFVEEYYDSDGNIVEEVVMNNDYDTEDNYHDNEDSYDVYVREMYKEKNMLEDMIELIEHTYDKRNKEHVNYLNQLHCSYAEVEDKIHRHESNENELEKIYGPAYIKYKSLYDEAVEKREREEQKEKENQNMKEFLEIINKPEKKMNRNR